MIFFFICEDNMICYFHTWWYHVFTWKLAWCFIGVYEISRKLPLHEVIWHIQDMLEKIRDSKQNKTMTTWPELLFSPFGMNHLTIAFVFPISWTLLCTKMWQICPKMNIFPFKYYFNHYSIRFLLFSLQILCRKECSTTYGGRGWTVSRCK